jgi:hypothetical protein
LAPERRDVGVTQVLIEDRRQIPSKPRVEKFQHTRRRVIQRLKARMRPKLRLDDFAPLDRTMPILPPIVVGHLRKRRFKPKARLLGRVEGAGRLVPRNFKIPVLGRVHAGGLNRPAADSSFRGPDLSSETMAGAHLLFLPRLVPSARFSRQLVRLVRRSHA